VKGFGFGFYFDLVGAIHESPVFCANERAIRESPLRNRNRLQAAQMRPAFLSAGTSSR